MTRQQKAILREYDLEGIPWYTCQMRQWRRPSLIRRFDQLGTILGVLIAAESLVIILVYLGYNGWRF